MHWRRCAVQTRESHQLCQEQLPLPVVETWPGGTTAALVTMDHEMVHSCSPHPRVGSTWSKSVTHVGFDLEGKQDLRVW